MVLRHKYFVHENMIHNFYCRIIRLRLSFLSCQIVIASIMCGYSKEDWTELAKMAEVI